RDDTTRRASAHQAPALGARLLERIADGQALLARDPADIVELGRHRHHATGEPRNLVAERTEGRDECDHLARQTLPLKGRPPYPDGGRLLEADPPERRDDARLTESVHHDAR